MAKSRKKIDKDVDFIIETESVSPSQISLDEFGTQTIDRHLDRITAELEAIKQLPVSDERDKIFRLLSVIRGVVETVDELVEPFPEEVSENSTWLQRDKSSDQHPYVFAERAYFDNYPLVHTANIKTVDRTLANTFTDVNWAKKAIAPLAIPTSRKLSEELMSTVFGVIAPSQIREGTTLDILTRAVRSFLASDYRQKN